MFIADKFVPLQRLYFLSEMERGASAPANKNATGETSVENTQNTPSAGRRGVSDLLKINGLVFPAFEHLHRKKSGHYGSSNQEDG